MKFFKLIGDIFNVSVKAGKIKNDEEKRPKSVRFAFTSIIYSVLAAAFAIGGALLLTVSADSLLAIFLVVIAVALIIGGLVTFIGALVRVIAQLRINRQPLGFIALAIFIVALIGSVAGIVMILA